MKVMLKESGLQDATIIFYSDLEGISEISLSPGNHFGSEIEQIRNLVGSRDFFKNLKVIVDVASRSQFPLGSVVDIGGVPINAPISDRGGSGASLMMSYINGEFRLCLTQETS
jgi:hypothetical protein